MNNEKKRNKLIWLIVGALGLIIALVSLIKGEDWFKIIVFTLLGIISLFNGLSKEEK